MVHHDCLCCWVAYGLGCCDSNGPFLNGPLGAFCELWAVYFLDLRRIQELEFLHWELIKKIHFNKNIQKKKE